MIRQEPETCHVVLLKVKHKNRVKVNNIATLLNGIRRIRICASCICDEDSKTHRVLVLRLLELFSEVERAKTTLVVKLNEFYILGGNRTDVVWDDVLPN